MVCGLAYGLHTLGYKRVSSHLDAVVRQRGWQDLKTWVLPMQPSLLVVDVTLLDVFPWYGVTKLLAKDGYPMNFGGPLVNRRYGHDAIVTRGTYI